jgi:hypothetical protein
MPSFLIIMAIAVKGYLQSFSSAAQQAVKGIIFEFT